MKQMDIIYIGTIASMAIGLIFTVGYIEQNKIYLHIVLKEHANDLQLLLQEDPHNALFEQDLNNTESQIKDLEHNKDEVTLFKLVGFFGAIMIVVFVLFPKFAKKENKD